MAKSRTRWIDDNKTGPISTGKEAVDLMYTPICYKTEMYTSFLHYISIYTIFYPLRSTTVTFMSWREFFFLTAE